MKNAEIYRKMGELSIKYANKGLTIDFDFNRFGMILKGHLVTHNNHHDIYSYNREYSYTFIQIISDTIDIETLVDIFKEEVFEGYRIMEKLERESDMPTFIPAERKEIQNEKSSN